MENQKKLETGVTKIGSVWALGVDGFYTEFDVYYGNILKPFINNQVGHMPIEWIVDGVSYSSEASARKAVEAMQQVKAGRADYSIIEVNDQYKAMLKAFLNEEQPDGVAWQIEQGGLEYAIPMDSEVFKASIDMLNKEKMAKMQMQKEQEERISATSKLHIDQIQAEENKTAESLPQSIPNSQTRLNDARLNNEGENKIKQEPFLINFTKDKTNIYKLALILLLCALIASSIFIHILNQKLEEANSIQKAKIALTSQSEELDEEGNPIIVQEEYEVPLATIEILEGEAKITVYSFQTNMVDGEFVLEAKKLGEYKLDADTYHKETKAEKEEREAKEAQEKAKAEEEKKKKEAEEKKRKEEEERKKQEENQTQQDSNTSDVQQ